MDYNGSKTNIVWETLIDSLKCSNIDVEKLIEDSVEYGLEVGIFKKSENGKILNSDKIETNNNNLESQNNEKLQNSNLSQSDDINKVCLRNRSRSDSKSTTPKKECTEKLKLKVRKQKCKPITVCAYCLGDEFLNNRTKTKEDMISCWDCGTCAHPTCLKWPAKLLNHVRNIRWQCLQCKCCSYCGKTSLRDEDMLLCDECDLGFHIQCFDPPLRALTKGEWICRICHPLSNRTPQEVVFNTCDFEFEPDCQIVTASNFVTPKAPPTAPSSQKHKYKFKGTNNTKITKSRFKPKETKQLSLLQRQRKKLITKAVQKSREILTDGLSNFFTPTNKRTSRVSNQANVEVISPQIISQVKRKSGGKVEESVDNTTDKSTPGVSKQNSKFVMSYSKKKSLLAKIKEKEKKKSTVNEIASARKKKLQKLLENSEKRKPGRPRKIEVSEEVNQEQKVEKLENKVAIKKAATKSFQITDMDRSWVNQIQKMVSEKLPPSLDTLVQHNRKSDKIPTNEPNYSIDAEFGQRNPPKIQIGRYIIQTWYSAPYPSEYARLKILYICEYCLKHIKTYEVYRIHMEKCTSYFPPGNEIYRKDNLSIFEVDGHISKLYCQQLCLLAKLFLDHKTLYYDVEPFLFYVAVIARNNSTHIIGYFSKEKRSSHKYNLSCIMVLPPYQRFNYGRFLIEFSYLLSRKEGEFGSPEKPLSVLGNLSYTSYWKSQIIPYMILGTCNDEGVEGEVDLFDFYLSYERAKYFDESLYVSSRITIEQICQYTGISPHDVASTIQVLCYRVNVDEGHRITIYFNSELIHQECTKYAGRVNTWIKLDPDALRWAPFYHPNDPQAAMLLMSEKGNEVINMTMKPLSKQKASIKKKMDQNKENNDMLEEKDTLEKKIELEKPPVISNRLEKLRRKREAKLGHTDDSISEATVENKRESRSRRCNDKIEVIDESSQEKSPEKRKENNSVEKSPEKHAENKIVEKSPEKRKENKSVEKSPETQAESKIVKKSPEKGKDKTQKGKNGKLGRSDEISDITITEMKSNGELNKHDLSTNETVEEIGPITRNARRNSVASSKEISPKKQVENSDFSAPDISEEDSGSVRTRSRNKESVNNNKEVLIKQLSPKIHFRHKTSSTSSAIKLNLTTSSVSSTVSSLPSPTTSRKRRSCDEESESGGVVTRQKKQMQSPTTNDNEKEEVAATLPSTNEAPCLRSDTVSDAPKNSLVNIDLTTEDDVEEISSNIPSNVGSRKTRRLRPRHRFHLNIRHQPILEKFQRESTRLLEKKLRNSPPLLEAEKSGTDSKEEKSIVSISEDEAEPISEVSNRNETSPPRVNQSSTTEINLLSPKLIEDNEGENELETHMLRSPSLSSLEYSTVVSDQEEEKEATGSSNYTSVLGPSDLGQNEEFRMFYNNNTDVFRNVSHNTSSNSTLIGISGNGELRIEQSEASTDKDVSDAILLDESVSSQKNQITRNQSDASTDQDVSDKFLLGENRPNTKIQSKQLTEVNNTILLDESSSNETVKNTNDQPDRDVNESILLDESSSNETDRDEVGQSDQDLNEVNLSLDDNSLSNHNQEDANNQSEDSTDACEATQLQDNGLMQGDIGLDSFSRRGSDRSDNTFCDSSISTSSSVQVVEQESPVSQQSAVTNQVTSTTCND